MRITTLEERHKIQELIEQGMTSKEISAQLGWSKGTIDKWRSSHRSSDLSSRMGRPVTGPMSDGCLSGTKVLVKRLRQEYPGWGGRMLRCELLSRGCELPSASSIHRYLKQEGLIEDNEKHEKQPVFHLVEVKAPHDLWQIDGMGNEVVNGLNVYAMLNIKDVFSSVHTSLFPAQMRTPNSHPATRHYQAAFRLGAMEHGLPLYIQSDHASVFFDNNSKSPFPTLFFLWALALGVRPVFSRVHQPTDQGKVEKSHQITWAQIDRKTPYPTHDTFFDYCQQRRMWLNECFPSSASQDLPPLVANPKARHSGRHYNLQTESQMICIERIYDYLENGKWWRRVSKDHTIALGGQVYYLSGAKPNTQACITFRKTDTSLLITIVNELCFKCKIKGISVETLMGKDVLPLPGVQLKLPFI